MRNQDTPTSDGGVTAARSDARISRGQAMVVVAIITLLYSVFPNRYPRFVSPNELSRILLTKSIVDEGTFVIDSGIRRTGEFGDLARFRGHYYSDKAPGLSLIAVPVYFVGRTFAGHQLNEIDAILLCKIVTVTIPAILFALFLVMTWRRSYVGAALVVFALFLGTPVFPQALSFTGHVPMTILCFLAAHRIRSYGDVSLRSAILAGALAGAAVLMDMSALIFCAIAVVAFRKVKPALAFVAACAVVSSFWLLYNDLCFNDPLVFAYHHMIRARDLGNRSGILFGAGMPRLHALWGLTFGAVRGVFVHSPFALAWVIGAWVTVRRDFEWRRDLFLLAIPPAYFLATASLPDWEGGWNLGCRYITPSMPFIAEAVARATEDRRVRLFVAASTGWAVALHSLAMATWSMPPAGFGFRFPAMQLSWFLALHGAFSKMFPLLHGVRPNVLLALVGFLGALGIIAAVPYGERRRTAIAIAAALCVFAVVGVMSGRRLPGESYRFAMQVASYMGYGWSPRL